MTTQYEVRSSLKDEVVFDAVTVAYEARLRRTTNRKAAERMARENTDPMTAEELVAVEVEA